MSFCKDTKNDLCALPCKNRCCKKALLYGMLLCGNKFSIEKIRLITEHERTSEIILQLLRTVYGINGNLYISEKKSGERKVSSYKLTVAVKEDLKKIFDDCTLPEDCDGAINPQLLVCQDCLRYFLRGSFLTAGTLSDPQTGYRMEFVFEDTHLAITMEELLSSFGFSARHVLRKSGCTVYIKDSESIEDFLTYIGASQAALTIMNMKIYRDIRNEQNRRSNCDTANISKMTEKAQALIKVIKALKNAEMFDQLPTELQKTAMLRLENPEASLAELAEMHQPPISKSGINHRFEKITEFYKKMTDG